MPFWKYAELSKTLSGLYYNQDKIIVLVVQSGLSPGDFNLHETAHVIFTLLIRELEQQGRLTDLLTTVAAAYPNNPVVHDILDARPVADWHRSVYAGPEIDPGGRRGDINFERITKGQSTLLPISFLEKGIMKAKPVARIVTPSGLGTGFLVSAGNILLTNNHVIEDPAQLAGIRVQFNYQQSIKNLPEPYDEFELEPCFFHTSVEDDWTIVKLKHDPAAKYGFLPLEPRDVKANDFVNIIQHPGGEYKHIGLYHNLVAYADQDVIRYYTDTMPGSSGSPVFDSEWAVVALHNSGGYFPATDGAEIMCNQGININKIITSLKGLLNS